MSEPIRNDDGNRRKFPRRAFNRGVGVLSAGYYLLAQGKEIGEGGLAFIAVERLEEGSSVVLNFQIPGGDFVSCISEVRSCKESPDGGFLHGCLFRGIKFEHKREIRSFVSSRS
jgi:hypothetical protein